VVDQAPYNDILGSPQPTQPGTPWHQAQALTLQQVQVQNSNASVLGALVKGAIAAGTADVDWYSFTLSSAATIRLNTFDQTGGLVSVLSLYNSDPDAVIDPALLAGLFNSAPNDPYDPLAHRLLSQVEGTSTDGTSLVRNLAAGTYYVAVSGAGNRYFHPFLADSGYVGSGGNFELAVEADTLPATTGPTVLEADPGNGAQLRSSPLVLRVDLSAALDPSTISSQSVQLQYSADGLTGWSPAPVALRIHFSPDANELQLTPSAPLIVGHYRLTLVGTGAQPLMDFAQDPLGQLNAASPGGDSVINFQVIGTEGRVPGGLGGDDTANTSHNLGDATNGNIVQVAGAIGADPYYSFFDPNNADPLNPNFQLPTNYAGADVDMYRFTVSGPGSYVVRAEVFAGRIGSPLDSGLSLFRVQGNQLVRVTANNNTLNNQQAFVPGMTFDAFGNPIVDYMSALPLSQDSAINAGLPAGVYYLAVSSGPNTPDPLLGLDPGANGVVFDPNIAHSGHSGINNANLFSVGPYVLNLRVEPNPGAPHVVSVSIPNNGPPIAPPDVFTVQFDQAMNLQQQAYAAYQTTTQFTVSSVFVRAPDGLDYYPRLLSYDPTTYKATFQMLDALPNGTNQLVLSGALGLTNLGGTPLVGQPQPGGDYIVTFTVQNSPRGTPGSKIVLTDQEPNNSLSNPQDLGVLFPVMQQAGIGVVRDFRNAPPNTVTDTADYFLFQVTQARQYTFLLSGSGLPKGTVPILTTDTGAAIPTSTVILNGGVIVTAFLNPGKCVVHVGGWTPAEAQQVAYRLYITIGQQGDNPTALTVGAAPALSIRLVNGGSSSAPVVVLPINNSGIVPVGLVNANDLPSLANLLPSSLLAKGAGGGVSGAGGGGTTGPNEALARSSSVSLVQDVLDLIVLTQLGTGGEDTALAPPTSWIQPFVGPVRNSWGQALDFLFRLSDWLDVSPLPSPKSAPLPASGSQETEMEDGTDSEAAAMPDPFASPCGVEDVAWVSVAAALALYHGETQRRRRPARPEKRRRKSSEVLLGA
jgi:hypothetical protein